MSERPAALLGYALGVVNEDRGVNYFGSAYEVVHEARGDRFDPAALLADAGTAIHYSEVHQEQFELTLSSGPDTVAVTELVEAVQAADDEQAATILARRPSAITGDHDAAAVPLIAAAWAGVERMVELFLAHGARVDATAQFDMTPLHWAAIAGHTAIATRLLDAGADGRRLSWFFLTADELAVLNGHAETAYAIATRTGATPTDTVMDRVVMRMSRGK